MKPVHKGLSVLLSLTTAVGLAACGSAAGSPGNAQQGKLDPANPTKLTFYSYSLAAPTMKAGMEHLIQEFNDTVGKEKGVVVEAVADPTFQQYKADISAGKPVDIVQHTFSTLDGSRQTLGFKAYEDIFPKEELEAHLKGIYPNALELGKIDGKMYGLAFTFSTPIVFINGKLFKDAGLNPANPPKTWAEIKEASLKIKAATGKDGFGLAPNNGWTTEALILSNGGEVLAKDRKSVKFGEPAAVQAIAMWQDLYKNGAHAPGNENELAEQFLAGNLGMYITSTAMYSGIRKASEAGGWEAFGAALPQFGSKPSIPVNSGSMLAVRTNDATKNAAAWEFIKFVTSDRGYTIITSEIGYLPLRSALADDPNGLKDFIDKHPLYRINLEQLSRIHPVAIWPGEYAAEITALFGDAVSKSVISNSDVAKTLQQAADEINKMIR